MLDVLEKEPQVRPDLLALENVIRGATPRLGHRRDPHRYGSARRGQRTRHAPRRAAAHPDRLPVVSPSNAHTSPVSKDGFVCVNSRRLTSGLLLPHTTPVPTALGLKAVLLIFSFRSPNQTIGTPCLGFLLRGA